MDCMNSLDDSGDPDCGVCLYGNSLVATYEDLPGWVFVLTEGVGGECEIVVYDHDGRRRLRGVGADANAVIGGLWAQGLELYGREERLLERSAGAEWVVIY